MDEVFLILNHYHIWMDLDQPYSPYRYLIDEEYHIELTGSGLHDLLAWNCHATIHSLYLHYVLPSLGNIAEIDKPANRVEKDLYKTMFMKNFKTVKYKCQHLISLPQYLIKFLELIDWNCISPLKDAKCLMEYELTKLSLPRKICRLGVMSIKIVTMKF